MKINYQSLEKKIDLKFKNKDILTQSLTHKSFNPKEVKAFEDFVNQENKKYRWGKATLYCNTCSKRRKNKKN